jgi:hypothetical protein
MRVNRSVLCGTAIAVGLLLAPVVQAQAAVMIPAPTPAVSVNRVASISSATVAAAGPAVSVDGIASVGSATIMAQGHANSLAAVAQCNVDSQPTNSAVGPSIAGVVTYGSGHSSCTRNVLANTTKSTATGTQFQLDALVAAGGPRIKVSNYQVTCRSTTAGTNVSWSFTGLTGLGNLPQNIPSRYTVPVYGYGGHLIAKAVFNDVSLSHPNNGGIALDMLHLELFPNGGGPYTGDVIVGTTACSPTS